MIGQTKKKPLIGLIWINFYFWRLSTSTRQKVMGKNMKIWFCHVTGGVNNYDFCGYLSESGIEYYRGQGCKVTRVEWQWKM
jgi:hypothetical protein